MTDAAKYRREFMRWIILLTLNNSRPLGNADNNILSVVCTEFADCTRLELQRELDYLRDRGLATLDIPHDGGAWRCDLTRDGIDMVEYTIDCAPGIACPQKYW
jgi:hypothetical protein